VPTKTKKTKKGDSIAKLNKKIRAANAAFEAMTKQEKRVAIAKDVLAALKAKKLKPKAGIYAMPTKKTTLRQVGAADADGLVNPDAKLCSVFGQLESCTVCGLGALFVSAVKRDEKVPIRKTPSMYNSYDAIYDAYDTDREWGISGHEVYDYLSKFFSNFQLMQIENAFECQGMNTDRNGFVKGPLRNAALMYHKIESPSKRMEAIMQNIIDNKGTFKTTKQDWCGDQHCSTCGEFDLAPFFY
jgi:hypothetical protein